MGLRDEQQELRKETNRTSLLLESPNENIIQEPIVENTTEVSKGSKRIDSSSEGHRRRDDCVIISPNTSVK